MNERHDQFKKGIGTGDDAREKRIEKTNEIRKKKRKEVLAFKRTQQTHLNSPDSPSFMQLSKTFNKQNLINSRDVESLKALSLILRIASDDEMQQTLHHLFYKSQASSCFDPAILICLIQICSSGSGGSNENNIQMASLCLSNIIGFKGDHVIECAKVVLENNFLDCVCLHALQKTPLAPILWETTGFLICSCLEARDLILDSRIFRNTSSAMSESTTPTPFLTSLKHDNSNPDTPYVALLVFCALLEKGEFNKVQPLVFVVWTHLVQLQARLGPNSDHMAFLLRTFRIVGDRCKDDDFMARLISLAPNLLSSLVQQKQSGVAKQDTVRFLVRVGQLAVPRHIFQTQMVNAGCIPLMVSCMNDASEELRRNGMMWIGNLAYDSLEFIEAILLADALTPIINTIRKGGKTLINEALYCIMTMFTTCVLCLDGKYSRDRIDCIMGTLIIGNGILQQTVRYIDPIHNIVLTRDVLRLWRDALKWKRKPVAEILENHGALDCLGQMLAHRDTTIYKLASEIEDMCSSGEGGEEMRNEAFQSLEFANSQPVFFGNYKF